MAELTRLQMARAAERALREIVSEGYFGSDQHELVLDALDALATVEAGSEWMPIDSAPMDGTPIILGYISGRPSIQGHSEEGFWMGEASRNHWGRTGWFATDDDILCDAPSFPDCWMPLPKPPAITAAPAEGGGARGAV